jgi:hypothetical protein
MQKIVPKIGGNMLSVILLFRQILSIESIFEFHNFKISLTKYGYKLITIMKAYLDTICR